MVLGYRMKWQAACGAGQCFSRPLPIIYQAIPGSSSSSSRERERWIPLHHMCAVWSPYPTHPLPPSLHCFNTRPNGSVQTVIWKPLYIHTQIMLQIMSIIRSVHIFPRELHWPYWRSSAIISLCTMCLHWAFTAHHSPVWHVLDKAKVLTSYMYIMVASDNMCTHVIGWFIEGQVWWT
jgi:hypothetical protein